MNQDPIPIPALTPDQSEYYRESNPEYRNQEPSRSISSKNYNTVSRWLPQWFENLRKNASLITEGFENGTYLDASHLRNLLKSRSLSEALILGSGPSADRLRESPLDSWNGLVFCGPSNASLLAACGRPADVVVAVDSAPDTWLQLRHVPHEENKTLLVTHPYIHPLVLKNWKGRVLFYRSNIPYGNHPFNSFVEHLYPMVTSWMLQSGCTVNQEVSLLSFLAPPDEKGNLTSSFPTKKAFLVGVDFGYPPSPDGSGFLGRCSVFKYLNGTYIKQPSSSPDSRAGYVNIRGILSDTTQLGYKGSLMYLYEHFKIPLFDCSNGIIRELPKYDIQEVIKTGGACAHEQTPQEIEARSLWYQEHAQEELPQDSREEEPSDEIILSRLQEKRGISQDGNSSRRDSDRSE